ncbi:MAG: hypothetical protein ACR2JH_07870 [Solirubrobacteraceae bacterium]
MPPIPFADNFLAGSLLTLLVPVGLVIVLTIWYLVVVRRVPEDTPVSSASRPPAEVVAAAPDSESTPAGPPVGES